MLAYSAERLHCCAHECWRSGSVARHCQCCGASWHACKGVEQRPYAQAGLPLLQAEICCIPRHSPLLPSHWSRACPLVVVGFSCSQVGAVAVHGRAQSSQQLARGESALDSCHQPHLTTLPLVNFY